MTTFKESVKQYIYSILFLLGFMGLLYYLVYVNYFYLGISFITFLLILGLNQGHVIDFFVWLLKRTPMKDKNGFRLLVPVGKIWGFTV